MLPNPNNRLHPAIEGICNKLISGHSPLCCVVGDETGVGKSMFAARMSELISNRVYKKKWLPQGNLFFSMLDFKKALFESNHNIFIIDEAEIELGSDNWQTIQNRWFARMKSTQRIKVNLYWVVLPMFMQLARKHRRAVNYIFDVKKRGLVYVWKLKKYSAQILGDDMGKSFLGGIRYNLPDCKMEYDRLDIENKKKIEIKENFLMEHELTKINKKMGLALDGTPLTEIKRLKKMFQYKCHSCGFIIESNKQLNKVVKCENCKQMIFITEQNLVKEPEDNEDTESEDDD